MPTIYNFIINSLKGKYFQNILNPSFIIQGPKSIYSTMISESALFAWNPLQKKHFSIPLKEVHLYREISKEKFKKIQTMYGKGLESQIEREHDQEIVNSNKANLSAQAKIKDYNLVPGKDSC